MFWREGIAILLLVGAGSACRGSDRPPAATAEQFRYAERARPSGTLAEVYDRSCRGCHAVRETGAPLTGHAAAWAPRLARGEAWLAAVKGGLGAMPPMGLCPDCTDDDFRALVRFMSEGPR